MKLSIVIPVYNVAPYLTKCLDSVLAQSEQDWECICVDDGSTDESGKILAKFAERDSRFRPISQLNAGVSAARNAGLDVAQGEWVHFMDSDDYLAPNFYEQVFDRVNETPSADVVVTAMTSLYVDGSSRIPNEGMGVGVVRGDVLSQVFRTSRMGIAFCMADKVCRRSLLTDNNIRFVRGMHAGEDSLVCLNVLAVSQCVVLDAHNNGYCYWHHPGSLTTIEAIERCKSTINFVGRSKSIWHRLRKKGVLSFACQAAAWCLFAMLDCPIAKQNEYLSCLIYSHEFKHDILPVLMIGGSFSGRFLALLLFVLPRPLCFWLLRTVRRVRHG